MKRNRNIVSWKIVISAPDDVPHVDINDELHSLLQGMRDRRWYVYMTKVQEIHDLPKGSQPDQKSRVEDVTRYVENDKGGLDGS